MIKITAIIFSVCVCAFCGAENIPVVAHRGYSAVAPENTMAAYRAAWKNNISYIEIDVYDLKDNNTVCIHDQKLKRVSHGAPDKIITQMTLQEIQQYDVGKWKNIRFAGEKVPLLEDVLAEMPPDSYIFLELKSVKKDFPLRFKKMLEKYKISRDRITVISFSASMLKNFNQQTPGYKTNLLLSVSKLTADKLIEKLKKCGVTGVGANVPATLTAEYVKKVKEAGFEFHVWTIDNPARAISLRNLGAESITTNVPVKIKKVLSRAGAGRERRKE